MNSTAFRVQSLMNKVPASVVDMIVELNQQMEATRHLDTVFVQIADKLKAIFAYEFTVQGDEFYATVNDDEEELVVLASDSDDDEKTVCCSVHVRMMNEDCTKYRMTVKLLTQRFGVEITSTEMVTIWGGARALMATLEGVRDDVKQLILGKPWLRVCELIFDLHKRE